MTQTKSEMFLSELETLRQAIKENGQKQGARREEERSIMNRITELVEEIATEPDAKNAAKQAATIRDLNGQLADLQLISRLDKGSALKERYSNLDTGLLHEAAEEYKAFKELKKAEIKSIREEANRRAGELNGQVANHPYKQAERIRSSIRSSVVNMG